MVRYSPILVGPQYGYDSHQPPPPVPPDPPYLFEYFRNRSQLAGGWFEVDQIQDSDGGRLTTGEKLLLTWPTSAALPDGVYYLRLRVRDTTTTRVSSPQAVRLNNTGPFPLPRPIITLQLQKPDGTLVPVTCTSHVKKGDGLILVTVQAYDPNMSSIAVTARGNSNISVPVVSTTSVPLSKTYNGNLADQGYVAPTSFLWDPFSDPNIIPCCYLVYVEIWAPRHRQRLLERRPLQRRMGRYRDWYLIRELVAGVHSMQAEVYAFCSRSNGRLSPVCITIFWDPTGLTGCQRRLVSVGHAFPSAGLIT